MKMIITSECEECFYGLIEENKGKVKVYCSDKDKTYWYGQCIPCDNKQKRRNDNESEINGE